MNTPLAPWKNLAIGAALLGLAGTALAHDGMRGHGGCDRGEMHAIYQLKDLTPAQRKQLDTLRKSERDAMRDTRDAMRDTRRDLRDAMENDADMDKIGKLADKEAAALKTMIMQMAGARKKVDAILTDKQREELKGMRDEHEHRHDW